MLQKKINIYMLFAGREVRIGKNCARGLEYGPNTLSSGLVLLQCWKTRRGPYAGSGWENPDHWSARN